MNAHEHDPSEFERRLASWLPAVTALDRDRMLFDAGRASARADARGKLWASAAVGLALLLAGLGVLFARERSQRLALERILAAGPPVQAPMLAATPMRVAVPASSGAARPDPSSYFVLTTRLASGTLDFPPASLAPNAGHPPGSTRSQPPTFRPRGFERVLDL